jgi:hypothetical protein
VQNFYQKITKNNRFVITLATTNKKEKFTQILTKKFFLKQEKLNLEFKDGLFYFFNNLFPIFAVTKSYHSVIVITFYSI